MTRIKPSISTLLGLVCLVFTISSMASAPVANEAGDSLERKIAAINKNAANDPVRPKQTRMSEAEINSYLNFNLKEKIPRGLANPQLRLVGDGQLAGQVFVDIDDFKRQRSSGGILDPLNYISGQVPFNARGSLRSAEGKGQFQLASAEILGVPLPKRLVQELVTFFSRTAENPNGIDIDAPFNLPAKIRAVTVNPGEAVATQ